MESAIRTEKLSKHFGAFVAVRELTIEIPPGEIFGFLGANGAGKTTAMKMLCGLSRPTSGSATIAGFDIYRQVNQIKRNIGYMSQKFSLYEDLTVRENITFYAGIYGLRDREIAPRREALIEKLGLGAEADKRVAGLPLGWRQKLAFSVAVFHRPRIVFLDEPTGGVDPVTRRQFWDLIYEAAREGITVFVTTHYMDEAEYCDRVCMMVDGEVAAMGTPRELRQSYQAADMDEVFFALARHAKRSDG